MRYKITDLAFFFEGQVRDLCSLSLKLTQAILPEFVVLWEMGLANLSRSINLLLTTMAELYSKVSQNISHTSKKLK